LRKEIVAKELVKLLPASKATEEVIYIEYKSGRLIRVRRV